jgi:hypothetical protein
MWKTGPDPELHRQYIAYIRHRAQAHHRGEQYELTWEDWQWLWQGHWHHRGRHAHNMVLTRIAWRGPWSRENCMTVSRRTQVYRQLEKKLELGQIQRIFMRPPCMIRVPQRGSQ